jgi:hypothetical protein
VGSNSLQQANGYVIYREFCTLDYCLILYIWVQYNIVFYIGAMLWAVWFSQNDIVFNKTPTPFYMQVIYRGTHWTQTWALFQKKKDQPLLLNACRAVETLTMNIFAKHGWRFSNRLS